MNIFLNALGHADGKKCLEYKYGDRFIQSELSSAKIDKESKLVSIDFFFRIYIAMCNRVFEISDFAESLELISDAIRIIDTKSLPLKHLLRSDFFSAFDGNGKYQLLFAIGHEFSHYLLGHLEKDREIEDEFECDKESIIRPHYPCEEYD